MTALATSGLLTIQMQNLKKQIYSMGPPIICLWTQTKATKKKSNHLKMVFREFKTCNSTWSQWPWACLTGPSSQSAPWKWNTLCCYSAHNCTGQCKENIFFFNKSIKTSTNVKYLTISEKKRKSRKNQRIFLIALL